ncbi:FAD-dependent oxidoreductase [Adhaeribacter arboris]|uniref:NADH:ubiquinone reductase (non-electrogenic) n=1 Tax=Adhaeribacter arboris TaxID=2072846 RepID=A0A2T2YLS8_9BACT|nr:NAD(P)/FAD-dependent oxidoreductase [Adhaeribacter arboris]PSR56464.1 FAD-dependent oxidoreductase [Adhaeribacter arboris]
MPKKVVIVGGGFAGLNLAKKLSNNRHFEVTVVDINNYHFFPPLLYQVSTAFIEATNICYPFRRLFQGRQNVRFYMGKLLRVIPESNTIETDNGSLSYDYLVLAMGTETNFFGNENVIRSALPMKTVDEALNVRNHILLHAEEAIRAPSLPEKARLANIVIAGGGPTGVEMAGMLAEMSRNIVAKDYPEAAGNIASIYLIDGAPTLLGPMSTKAQKEAYQVLNKLGVKIILNTLVKDYVNDEVLLSNGEKLSSATLIWASGVVAREVVGLPKEAITRGRRILVDEINRVTGFTNIFAIGDQCAQTSDKDYPNGHPQLAQVAIQQGQLLAENLERLEENKPVKAFRYNNKGSMAIISKYKAVVDLPKGFFKGFFAWLVWLFIHIIPLVGFRNKLNLAYNWMWSFITNDPTLRLIIRPGKKENQSNKTAVVNS